MSIGTKGAGRRVLVCAGCVFGWLSAVAATAADTTAAIRNPDDEIVELYTKNRLFLRTEFKTVRSLAARRFEAAHSREIDSGLGEDRAGIDKFFADNPDIREDLYTALDGKHDRIADALRVFKSLWSASAAKVKSHAQLAIAVAVTWDHPQRGLYSYVHHQKRTRSILPDGRLDHAAAFNSLLDGDAAVRGRMALLPWEFLVYVIDHDTPAPERKWAFARYNPRRVMFGACYKDVPYDMDMLNRNQPHLEGKPYTLESIQANGGVCAMQADFAARVGKSIGIPSAYVRGEANSGVRHAWVMWVEIRSATRNQIGFSLESYGRYRQDKYYVGDVDNPQTGRDITDRELELRLTAVGNDTAGTRQARLAMEMLPLVTEKLSLDAAARLKYFDKVLTLCPTNEEAWLGIAAHGRASADLTKQTALMMGYADRMFKTFAKFPDFTWKVFEDLLASQTDVNRKANYFAQLVGLYDRSSRPDLACQAVLKLTELYVAAKKPKDALTAMAATMRRYPDEGRYVPKVAARMEEIGREVPRAEDVMVFYVNFLPHIPTHRIDEVSEYCVKMYERAIKFLRDNNQSKKADELAVALERIRSAGK